MATRILPDGTELPACITHGCDVIAETQPNLTGRRMRCSYNRGGKGCPRTRHGGGCCQPGEGKQDADGSRPSTLAAAFFVYLPDQPFDTFYCGCWGWD